MRRGHAVWQVSQSAAALLLTVALAPLIMVAGEPLRRYVLARPTARPPRLGWYRTLRRGGGGAPAAAVSPGPPATAPGFWHPSQRWLPVGINPPRVAPSAPP